MQKTILEITGMHCASCAANIENALKKEAGIKTANVNFASEKLYLEFDSIKTKISGIIKIIEKLGYGATEETFNEEMHDHHKEVKAAEIKKLRNTFVFSAILGLPIFYLAMSEMLNLPRPQLPLKLEIIVQF